MSTNLIDAWETYCSDTVRRYTLAAPLTARTVDRVEGTGDPVYSDTTVEVIELTVEIPEQYENSITIPAVLVTGSAPGIVANVRTYPAALPYEQVLGDLGIRVVDGTPPPPPEPHLVGAVPTEPDLPSEPDDFGVYLVRADNEGRCWIDGTWQTAAWSDGCEQAFGPADDVPDLEAS